MPIGTAPLPKNKYTCMQQTAAVAQWRERPIVGRDGHLPVPQVLRLRPDVPGVRLVRIRGRPSEQSAGRRPGCRDGVLGSLRERHHRRPQDQGHTRGPRLGRRGALQFQLPHG